MRWLLSIVLLTIWGTSLAQTFELQTEAKELLIGEQTTVSWILEVKTSDTVAFSPLQDTLVDGIEIVMADTIDTSYIGDQLQTKRYSQSITVTSFDSGIYVVKPLIAVLNDDTIRSNPILIHVQTIEVDTSKGIADIKHIEQVPFDLIEWFDENQQWFYIGLAVLLVIAAIIYFLLKRKPKEVVEPVIPERPPHEIALERLSELAEAKLWQSNKTKEYYSELTEILRQFVELRFRIAALEQTSDEIVQALRRSPDFTKEEIDGIKRLLFLADLVKFAKENPLGSENDVHFDSVKTFVNRHISLPPEPDKTEDDA